MTTWSLNGDHLIDAFREDISCTKGKEQYSMNYKHHVDYIWTVVDPSRIVLPTCGLGNPILLEDVYHKRTFSQVGKGGNKVSTLRVRFTALKACIAFLRRRKIYGGMTRAPCRNMEFGFHRHGCPNKIRHTKNKEKGDR